MLYNKFPNIRAKDINLALTAHNHHYKQALAQIETNLHLYRRMVTTRAPRRVQACIELEREVLHIDKMVRGSAVYPPYRRVNLFRRRIFR